MQRREFLTLSTLAALGGLAEESAPGLFNPIAAAHAQAPAGTKPPTQYTIAANKKVLEALPFSDTTDFELAKKGFIAGLPDGLMKNAEGKVVFDAKKIAIPLDAPAPDTWNPSLWRVSKLLGLSGLFKVTDRLYQVRSLDVANMTIMEGKTGLIIIDCMTAKDAAKAALELYYQHRPRKPVVAVIFTHSHVDHFGGVGAVTTAADVAARKVKIIAPAGFTEEAVSENLYAGNAMFRRSMYQYGAVLPTGTGGNDTLGSGLGTGGIQNPPTLILPTHWVTKTGQKMTIDGLEFEFLMAPGSEAPSEMHFYTPALKALCTAENACHTLHNFYTLRGAKTRDTAKWVKYLNQTLDMWGDKVEVLYAPHQWPMWGNAAIIDHIEKYRDTFKFIHDRSLHLANSGYTMPEIGEMVQLPPALAKNWATRGYYGTVSHNSRAVYNFYLGYFSGNPAELNPLPPVQAASRYVEMMGGADTVISKAREAYEKGDYRWAAQLLEHVVYADANNKAARELQADAFEQLGYQSEAATWRNFYMVGAQELRRGVPDVKADIGASADLIKNTPLDMVCDYIGIALDTRKAGDKTIRINLEATGTGEKRSLVLKNGVVNSRAKLDPKPDVTLNGRGEALNAVLMGGDPAGAIKAGNVSVTGRPEALTDLLGMVTPFEFWFPIVTRPAMS